MNLSEFDLIERLRDAICLPEASAGVSCALGIGDDGAVLEVPAGQQLVVCTDALVAGVHFPDDATPEAVGHKALAVNLSDLAAMGARPAWFFMALSLSRSDEEWIDRFARGMAELARQSRVLLAGGDVTSGPLNISVTALGLVDKGRALTRSGARPGDGIFVSGRPGAAAHALQRLQAGAKLNPAERAPLDFPQPRLGLGLALSGVASACIDLSDGLAADLGHVVRQSRVSAVIDLDALPCPPGLADRPGPERWPLQLTGGDDYELCFTLAGDACEGLDELAAAAGTEITRIGEIRPGSGLEFRTADGRVYQPDRPGYRHFNGQAERP